MATEERRKHARIDINLDATLIEGGARRRTRVVDLGRGGARLTDDVSGAGVLVLHGGRFDIPRRFHSIGPERAGGVRFEPELAESDLAELAASSERRREALERDHAEVSNDLRMIQTCRGQVYVGTLAAVATSATATATVAFTQKVTWFWVYMGSLMGFVLLSLGILTLLEKARSISVRRAFLFVLEDIVRDGSCPSPYLGWSRYLHMHDTCGVRREIEARRTGRSARTDRDACLARGRAQAANFVEAKFLAPALLDSFTSLSAWSMSALYVAWTVMSNVAFFAWFTTWFTTPAWAGLLTIVQVALAALLGWFYVRQYHDLRKGRFSFESYCCMWRLMLSGCACSRVCIGCDDRTDGSF